MSREIVVNDQSMKITTAAQRALVLQRKPSHNAWLDLKECAALGNALLFPIYSPDGKNLERVELRDIDTIQRIQSCDIVERAYHEREQVSGQVISSDGQKLIAAVSHTGYALNTVGDVYIWDIKTGKLQKRIRTDYLPAAYLLDEGIKMGDDPNRIYYYVDYYQNNKRNYVVKRLALNTGHVEDIYINEEYILAIDLTKDGKRIAVADGSDILKIIDTQTGKVVSRMFYRASKRIRRMALSNTGSIAVLGSDDETLGVVDMVARRVRMKVNIQSIFDWREQLDKRRFLRFEYVQISGNEAYAAAVYQHTSQNRMGMGVWDINRRQLVFSRTNETAYSVSSDDRQLLKTFTFSDETIDQICGEYRKAVLQCAVLQQKMLISPGYFVDTMQCPSSGKIGFDTRYERNLGTIKAGKRIVQVLDVDRLVFDEMIYNGRSFAHKQIIGNRMLISHVENGIEYFDCWDMQEKKLITRHRVLEWKNRHLSHANQHFSAYRFNGKMVLDEKLRRMVYENSRTEIITLDAQGGKTTQEVNEHVIAMNAKHIVTLVDSDRRLNVYTKHMKLIGWAVAAEGKYFSRAAFSNNADAFYVSYGDYRNMRYEIRSAEIVQTGFEHQEPKNPSLRLGQTLIESFDGRYIITQEDEQIVLFDNKKHRRVYSKQLELPETQFPSNWRLERLDRNMRFVMIDSGNGRFVFFDPFSLDYLATLTLMWQGKWLWTTPPDEIAPGGWFYTNAPEVLNIYRKNADGSAEVLNPTDTARTEYILRYGRMDMVKKRLLSPKQFQEDIIRLAQRRQDNKRLAELSYHPILLCTSEV